MSEPPDLRLEFLGDARRLDTCRRDCVDGAHVDPDQKGAVRPEAGVDAATSRHCEAPELLVLINVLRGAGQATEVESAVVMAADEPLATADLAVPGSANRTGRTMLAPQA